MSPITLLKKKTLSKVIEVEHDLITDKPVKIKPNSFADFKNRVFFSVLILIFVVALIIFSYFANFAQYFYNGNPTLPSGVEKTFASLLFFTLWLVMLLMVYEISQFLFFRKKDVLFFTLIFGLFTTINYFLTTNYFVLQFLWQNNSSISSFDHKPVLLVNLIIHELTSFNLIAFFVSLFIVIGIIISYGYNQGELNNRLFLLTVFTLFLTLFFKIFSFLALVLGPVVILFLFLLPFTSDTFALLFGRWFGKRKIFPKVSPNKTIFGSVSGFFAAFIIGFLYVGLLKNFVAVDFIENNLHSHPSGLFYLLNFDTGLKKGYYFVLALLLILFIFSIQFGDFLFSFFKRACYKKDFSNLLGQHGGLFDRFDALFFFFFLYYTFFCLLGK